jgi:ribosomal protein S18 acetylase RimI-like enzyme/ketosteroid isomerase-like protein
MSGVSGDSAPAGEIALIERTWAALGRGELEIIEESFAPDARWVGVDEGAWSCESRRDIIEVIGRNLGRGLSGSIERMIPRRGGVLVAFRPDRPDPGGRPLEDGIAWVVVTVRTDRIVELKGCVDEAHALAYADSAEPAAGSSSGFAAELEPEPELEAEGAGPAPPDRPRPDGSDIRRVTEADVPKVARALAEAFFADPHFCWIVRDDARRMGKLVRGFEMFTRRIWLPAGECYTHERLFGAAMWMPPGTWHMGPLEQLRLLPVIAGNLRLDLPRFLKALNFVETKHPHVPEHWYLPALGVAPALQGRGFGAVLLQVVLARCDAERAPAYLEASTARNRALYERHGFETLEECRYAREAPPLWRMWREPRR